MTTDIFRRHTFTNIDCREAPETDGLDCDKGVSSYESPSSAPRILRCFSHWISLAVINIGTAGAVNAPRGTNTQSLLRHDVLEEVAEVSTDNEMVKSHLAFNAICF